MNDEGIRRWLGDHGVVERDGGWATDDDVALSASDLAHEWTDTLLADTAHSPAERLDLALNLLVLLDSYQVTVELGWFVRDNPELADTFWRAYRGLLERPQPLEAVPYSLWVDHFEDPKTVHTAFAEVLGNDLPALADADETLLRRARRVLEVSGPVPWPLKRPVYLAAARHSPYEVFRGILTSYHDAYGKLEPAAALALLDTLDLPEDTEFRAPLRVVLANGVHNHRYVPNAWEAACRVR